MPRIEAKVLVIFAASADDPLLERRFKRRNFG
jgi:hypothetical protein